MWMEFPSHMDILNPGCIFGPLLLERVITRALGVAAAHVSLLTTILYEFQSLCRMTTFVNLALLEIQMKIGCTMKTPSGMGRNVLVQIAASSTTLRGSASN